MFCHAALKALPSGASSAHFSTAGAGFGVARGTDLQPIHYQTIKTVEFYLLFCLFGVNPDRDRDPRIHASD